MKKKILTVALAATMAISSVFCAFAGTSDVDITEGLGSANTGDETVSGDFDVTYTFKNESHDASANYNNFAVEVFGEGFGITARADAYAVGYNGAESVLGGWGDSPIAPTTTWEGLPDDWAVWAAGMANANVTANIKRANNVLTLTYKFTTSDGASYTFVGTTPAVDTMPSELGIHLTGEKVKLSDVTFSNNKVSTNVAGDQQTSTNAGDNGNTPTGDNSNMVLLGGAALIAAAAAVVAKKKMTN